MNVQIACTIYGQLAWVSDGSAADPLGERAAVVFAADLAADRLPSIRAIRAALHAGQPRAQRLRGYLATGGARQAENPTA
jgi:hypothetical protein